MSVDENLLGDEKAVKSSSLIERNSYRESVLYKKLTFVQLTTVVFDNLFTNYDSYSINFHLL